MANSTIDTAAFAISAGQLVAFPTETVYGLGADACNDSAVAQIFASKGRPSEHPLIVHIASASGVSDFAYNIPAFAQKLMTAFWPGPLTLILPRKPDVATVAAGGQDSIGLRCPSHPMALSLLRTAQSLGVLGIAAPSANRFGRISPTSAQHVREEFGAAFVILDGGDCQVGIESAIVDCTRGKPVLLRPGQLTRNALAIACAEPLILPHEMPAQSQPRASGTLSTHYAPRAKLRLVSAHQMQELQNLPFEHLQAKGIALFPLPQETEQAAQQLFARLRELDAPGIKEILVTQPPQSEAWEGVSDRLSRAAA